jgi:hypothetical protein
MTEYINVCDVSTDNRKLLRFVDSNPKVVQGSYTLFGSVGLCLKPWFLEISDYNFQSVSISSGSTSSLSIDGTFLMVKVDWGSTAAIADKEIEMILPENYNYIGSEIPGGTGVTGTTGAETTIKIKDLFVVNSKTTFEEVSFTNNSTENCVVNIMTANSKY